MQNEVCATKLNGLLDSNQITDLRVGGSNPSRRTEFKAFAGTVTKVSPLSSGFFIPAGYMVAQ